VVLVVSQFLTVFSLPHFPLSVRGSHLLLFSPTTDWAEIVCGRRAKHVANVSVWFYAGAHIQCPALGTGTSSSCGRPELKVFCLVFALHCIARLWSLLLSTVALDHVFFYTMEEVYISYVTFAVPGSPVRFVCLAAWLTRNPFPLPVHVSKHVSAYLRHLDGIVFWLDLFCHRSHRDGPLLDPSILCSHTCHDDSQQHHGRHGRFGAFFCGPATLFFF
jgi:hypothetical protein